MDIIMEDRNRGGRSIDARHQQSQVCRIETLAGGNLRSQQRNLDAVNQATYPKTLGHMIANSENIRALERKGGTWRAEVEFSDLYSFRDSVRADLLTSSITNYNGIAGAMPVVTIGVQPRNVAMLFAEGPTTLNAIPFMRETAFTPTAAAVAEGAAKPEQAFTLEQSSAPVKKIAAWTTVSDELLDDAPTLGGYLDSRLIYSVEIKEDDALLNGAGGSNITGVLQTANIQTQALGADTKLDAIFKAITKVRNVGFADPDGVVMHPNDWQEIRLLKDGNLNYFGGGPFTGAYGTANNPGMFVWDLPVVLTTAISEGTALVGAFKQGAQIWRRMGIHVDMTNSNEDDFKNNLVTIRAEERFALCVYRPLNFCTVTGI